MQERFENGHNSQLKANSPWKFQYLIICTQQAWNYRDINRHCCVTTQVASGNFSRIPELN